MDNYIGKRLDGRYEIKEIIGVGGMAYVYKAYDNIDNRTVAIKILKEEYLQNEEFTRRFKNESKAIAILSHPNIVKVYDVSFGERMQYIVMEYIDGITLKEYIDGQAEFKWKEAVHFTVQILRALQHAHDKGIVHRDIKPQNIMLLPDGTIKVADFGIARFSRQDMQATRATDKAIGSVHYISPEQARGELTDEKADLYSVGVMLYEMLTGKLPFEADSAVSVAIMQMQSEATPPRQINPAIPEGLEDITIKAMQKDTSKRYQSAAEMLYDIDEFKKNPSIHFEYKYFVDDSPTRYMDTISKVRGTEQPKPVRRNKGVTEYTGATTEKENGKKQFPIIPVLCAVAGAFVLAVLIFVGTALFGEGGILSNSTETVEVPNFIGMTIEEINNHEEFENWQQWFVFTEYEQEYDETPVGTVIDQSLRPESQVVAGVKDMTLTISKGPKQVQVPDVVGLLSATAKDRLEAAGFAVVTEWETSDAVAQDLVIALAPAQYPQELQYGSTITMLVSSGATPVEPVGVPNVTKLLKDQAVAQLESAGFVVKVETVNDSSVNAGTVVWQSVAADTPALPGTEITIRVSSGFAEVNLQIALPTHITSPVDLQIYIDGVKQGQPEGIMPNMVQKKDLKLSEAKENYKVSVYISENGKNNWKLYAEYQINGKTGTIAVLKAPDLTVLDAVAAS